MLLDANNTDAAPPPAPLPDRPARADAAPRNRDDRPSSGNQGNDSSASSTQANSNSPNTQDTNGAANGAPKDTKADDGADDTGGKVSTKDSAKDGTDTSNTDDSDNGQNVAATTDSGTQLVSALAVIGVANAPAPYSTGTAPVQPSNVPSDSAVIPPAAQFAPVVPVNTTPDVQAPQTGQPVPNQTAGDSESADASPPIDLANAVSPALQSTPDNQNIPAEVTAATTAAAPAEPVDDEAPAIAAPSANSAKPAEPPKKIVLSGQIDSLSRPTDQPHQPRR